MKNIKGISEIMFYRDYLDISEFLNLNSRSLLDLFEDLIQNQSERLFVLENIEEIFIDKKRVIVNCIDSQIDKSNKYKLYIYEKLEHSKVTIDLNSLPDKIDVRLINKDIFDDRDIFCFSDYKFFESGNELDAFIESESHGSLVSRQLYIKGENDTLYNIDLLNDDIDEELEAIKEMID
jgi:hypothetical protein